MTKRRGPKMDCPACGHWDSRVLDTRGNQSYIWRRRVCEDCGHRFSTTESVQPASSAQPLVRQS